MKIREKTEWSGEYKGISWEIQRWPGYQYESIASNKWNWTMYLYLWLDRIPDNAESYWLPPKTGLFSGGRIHYDYPNHEVLSGIKWNGGITWYSKESGHDGEKRVIKVGCDFQHLWDHEHGDYTLDSILYHVREAVDSFREAVPGYRYWCRQDGKLHDPGEVEIFPDGEYRCECGKTAAKVEERP